MTTPDKSEDLCQPVAWIVERRSDSTFPRFFTSEKDADFMVEYVTVSPPAVKRALFARPVATSGGELRRIADDCRAAARTYRTDINNPVSPDSVAAIYERIAFSLDRIAIPSSPDKTEAKELAGEALRAAEQCLIDLVRPLCSVYNRATKMFEFDDEHIARSEPGTWVVIQQIRAALTSPAAPRTEAVAWRTPIRTGHQLTTSIEVADRWREHGAVVEPLGVLSSSPLPGADAAGLREIRETIERAKELMALAYKGASTKSNINSAMHRLTHVKRLLAALTAAPSPDPAEEVKNYLVNGHDLKAMSGSVESDRVIQLHFRRKVNDRDHEWLLDAINAKIKSDQAPYPAEVRRAAIEEALEECVSVLAMAERPAHIDPDHGEEVAALGDRIGYGALMASASASWRARLEERGNPVGGEFVAGPCHSTVIATLKKARDSLAPEVKPVAGSEKRPFDVMDTIDPDFADSFERGKK